MPITRRWQRDLDQAEREPMGKTCQYWNDMRRVGVECGKPATHSWRSIVRGQIAVCSDCISKNYTLKHEAVPLSQVEAVS